MAKRLYQVQAGESLSRIARDRLGDVNRWKELAYINSIEYPYIIRPGQLILLPDSTEPIELVVTGAIPPAGAAAAVEPSNRVAPAITLLALAAVVAVLLGGKK